MTIVFQNVQSVLCSDVNLRKNGVEEQMIYISPFSERDKWIVLWESKLNEKHFQYRKYSVVYSNDFKESDLKKTWLS